LAAVAALAQAGPKTDAAKEPATTTAPKPEVKTAEQQFKNIQFLKAVPADQLIPAMQYINAALGVECNFCHVGQPGRLEPDKDDKKEKQTARKMRAMTKAINDANFEGKSEVSCTTCHAGHAHPIALPPLFDEHNPNAHDANRHDLPHPELPTLEQVAQAYEKAIGGKEAIQKLATRTLKATAVGFQGQKFQIEAWQKAPGMLVQSITFPNGQTRVQIFDGQSGWIKTDRGVNQISGPDLAGLRVVSRFDRDLAPLADLANARVTGIEKIDGHECYVVRGLHSDKDFSDRLYFDKQSGLLLRRTSAQRTILGQVSDNTDYSDYKDVQGVKVAFTIKRTTSENVLTRTLEKIEFNQPVDDSKFARPAAPGGGGK
ncbi:MAG TPA: c-type cytochrome, partial [Terriglobales bacterium]|nr:c-type cytochrome [Terriglobales bacterium]